MSTKRMMLFVDAQNLTNSARNVGITVDAIELRTLLSNGSDLLRACWFDSFPTEDQIEAEKDDGGLPELSSKEGFFYFLSMSGYSVDANPLSMEGREARRKGS